MREKQSEEIRAGHRTGWLDWAGRHPGLALLGSLALAILAFRNTPEPADTQSDAGGEEVALFI
jgi:hypothetical protein